MNKLSNTSTYVKAPRASGVLMKDIFKTFLKGLLIALPIMVIIFLAYLFIKTAFNLVSPISGVLSSVFNSPPWIMHIFSVLLLGVIFFALGMMVRNHRQRKLLKRFETEYLCRVPLYTTIREAVEQFSNLKEVPFSQVVLVDTFGTGVWMTGFISEKVDEELYTVFVPTAPNPTNGNIYHVPEARLRFLDVKPETAMRTIVGMGTGSSFLLRGKDREVLVQEAAMQEKPEAIAVVDDEVSTDYSSVG